ncbi:hypothetical protein PoB_004516500 [Plakobranchus ocellatus]|uniref:Uncharacterized protein n=1 Tax=Plakobranchus ocellatus TaxID=259542 RepID=A0AAV4BHU3_9GAST|nr:hypothetical protein PoB_004516500 [Plakobranchus ocellatus]
MQWRLPDLEPGNQVKAGRNVARQQGNMTYVFLLPLQFRVRSKHVSGCWCHNGKQIHPEICRDPSVAGSSSTTSALA